MSIKRICADSPEWRSELEWFSQVYFDALEEEMSMADHLDVQRCADRSKEDEIFTMMKGLIYDKDDACLLIEYQDQMPRGYFLGLVKSCVGESPERIGYLNGLYVLPSYRDQGIGRSLYEAGADWFREQNLEYVELYTAKGNARGKKFWKQLNFVSTEEVMLCKL